MSSGAHANGLSNPVLERLHSGDVALGMGVRLARSVDIARIAKSTGHDFLFIDAQHSPFNLETIVDISQAAMACGVAPLVRVRSVDDPDVQVMLDNGVMGIVFPNVDSAEEARRGVQAARFPPIGRRSATGGYPHFDYGAVALATSVDLLDRATVIACMIESPAGLDNVESIAAVEGVDVVHVGTNDLLFAMGRPGKFDDPAVNAALERTIAAAAANGKFAGCGGNRDMERQAELIRRGIRFVTTKTDIQFLSDAAARWTSEIRQALSSGGPPRGGEELAR